MKERFFTIITKVYDGWYEVVYLPWSISEIKQASVQGRLQQIMNLMCAVGITLVTLPLFIMFLLISRDPRISVGRYLSLTILSILSLGWILFRITWNAFGSALDWTAVGILAIYAFTIIVELLWQL